jgi:6-phosphogluconolactonase
MKRTLVAMCMGFLAAGPLWAASQAPDVLVYVGTYTGKGSEGVYVYHLDSSTGGLKFVSKAAGLANPSFLAIDPKGRCVYAVREFGGKGSAVVALSRNSTTGELSILNEQPSGGQGPCYVTVDREGRFLLVANYGSGHVAVLPIADDGRLQPATSVVRHEGSSVNPARQKEPHAHSIVLDAANRYALAADLGIDKVMVYRLDSEHGKLLPNDPPFVRCEPGSGPRHIAFHPSGKYVYVIEELSSTVEAFNYDADAGTLKPFQRISTLPDGFTGKSTCADIHVHPSGRFLYGSNRGHDSIVSYAIDDQTGKLRLIGHEPTQGKAPRNFAIDPSGTFLLAANQDSDSIVSFRINPDTGALTPTGQTCKVSMPVCLKMVVSATGPAIDPAGTEKTFLRRSSTDSHEGPVDLSTPTAHYKPLFGAGDSDSGIIKGIERYGELTVEPRGSTKLVSYRDAEGVLLILAGSGVLLYASEKVPVKQNDFVYLPVGIEHGVSNPSHEPLRLLVMGYRIPPATEVPPTPGLMMANADDVQQQTLSGHGPSTQFKLLMGTTQSKRDKLAAAVQVNSLFLMDFAAGGTNIPHRHNKEEEIYYVLRGSGDMVAGTDAAGKEMRYPCRQGDAFYFPPGTLIGFYSGVKEGEEHAQILAVRSACPALESGALSGDASRK